MDERADDGSTADDDVEASESGGAANSQASRSLRTRKRILKAAHDAFVRQGFAGATIERIALAAQTNKRLVYHHFGGKDALFRVVLENAYGDMRAAERSLRLETYAPREAIARLVRFTWDYYGEHEDFISLVASENLCQAEHVKASERFPELSSSLQDLVTSIVNRGIATGEVRRDIDPVQLWISVAGLCWFYVANKHTIAATFGTALMSADCRDRRLNHILALVDTYLVDPEQASPR